MTETQASPRGWAPPGGWLGTLMAGASNRAAALASELPALERAARAAPDVASFTGALRGREVSVIAEIKRRSPSKGVIDDTLDAPARALVYAAAGAAALSVLTERAHFGGTLDDLCAVRAVTRVPLLRKDFIVHRAQLCEARAAGASAALLIARALAPGAFASLAAEAADLGLDVLLEVRDEAELERALGVPGGVIGINNRNLETLAVDDAVSERLIPLVPPDRIVVYESGIRDRAGVERAAAIGADAVLVGSSLSAAADGASAATALTGVPRRGRGR